MDRAMGGRHLSGQARSLSEGRGSQGLTRGRVQAAPRRRGAPMLQSAITNDARPPMGELR